MRNLPLTRKILKVATLAALLLVVPRFFPISKLCSRGLECAQLFREPQSQFRSHFKEERPSICGDLATMSHRPDLCILRPEVFETDEFGFRNESGALKKNPELLVFGDSFAFGQGVTQAETPAAHLERQLKRPVYNGAGKLELRHLRWLIDHLGPSLKEVWYFHLERHHRQPDELADFDKIIQEKTLHQKLNVMGETLKAYNPLKIISGRIDKDLMIPKVFPNRFEESVPVFKLKNGQEILFLKSSVDRYGDLRTSDIEPETDFFKGLKAVLEARGLALKVILLPEKYTVYAPLIAQPPRASISGPQFLDSLSQALTAAGISNQNMLSIFLEAASKALEKNEYIYWLDDTHWNSKGISLLK